MHTNPLSIQAKRSSDLLDAAAHVLDSNIVIREAERSKLYDVAKRHKGNVFSMLEESLESLSVSADRSVKIMIEDEIKSLYLVAKATKQNCFSSNDKVSKVLGKSLFYPESQSDVRIEDCGDIEGLVHSGSSILGASCPFVIKSSGMAGTRGFWLDNLTGLPVKDWLEHRSDILNYTSEFKGGPWSGRKLSDEQILKAKVRHSSTFCDYAAYKSPIMESSDEVLCFRFQWNDRVHSYPLDSDGESFAQIQRRIKNYPF